MKTRKIRIRNYQIAAFDEETAVESREDLLSVEEPLQVMAYSPKKGDYAELAVFMRTPGDDFSLVLGFLFTESMIQTHSDVRKIFHCTDVSPAEKGNTVKILFAEKIDIDKILENKRHFLISSGCGICGDLLVKKNKTSKNFPEKPKRQKFDSAIIPELAEKSRRAQFAFEKTGGLHASSLFDLDGTLLDIKEDVGRHNALDKIIGAFLDKAPLTENILLLSGRVSYELVQKAGVAGIPCICCLGAPSSLAVEMAEKFGITLIGFLKSDHFNCYSHCENLRISENRKKSQISGIAHDLTFN